LKDDKEKVSKKHIKITAKLAERFQRLDSQGNPDTYIPHAEKIINEILLHCCLKESQSRKLLNLDHLNASGDGSKLKAHSSPYGKKVCDCDSSFSNPCDCKRFYNSPEASWGYDSYRECYVHGYNLYQLNSFSLDNKAELPVYLMMVTGARHDSVPGMYAMQRATKAMGYHIDNGCFDAAHDATDFYRMSRDVWKMNPFIPLNNTNEGNIKNLPMLSITGEGIPVCQGGYQMYYFGHEKDRDRVKWRCPIKASRKNQNLSCKFINLCSPSPYGRVVYTHPKDNPRLYPPIPRTSKKWQDTYDHRTSAERVFKREKNDFKLTFFKTRSKERFLFYALLTAIGIHLDTWYKQENQKEKAP